MMRRHFSIQRAIEEVVCLSNPVAAKSDVTIQFEPAHSAVQVTLPEGE